MELKRVLACSMEIGKCMLVSGAGVSRVEDTIERICQAYGGKNINVFSITSSIVTSLEDENGEIITQTKRIRGYHTDFLKLDQLNCLSRQICASLPGEEEICRELERIKNEPVHGKKTQMLISALIAGSFCVFFGGDIEESLLAFLVGGMVMIFKDYMKTFISNPMFLNFIASFFVASVAYLTSRAGIAENYGAVIIGNIMLLVPGVAFVNSLRDMIGGDTMSGILTLCESVLLAIFLAGGSFAAIVLWGGAF